MNTKLTGWLLAAMTTIGFTASGSIASETVDSGSDIETVALWLFDEPAGLYPSSTLDDSSGNDMPLSLGISAQIVEGHYGRSLLFADQARLKIPEGEENFEMYGFTRMPPAEGRTIEPMTWFNAKFAAVMTSGETHLRKEVGFVNPSSSALNLGGFDWTVEFWYSAGVDASEDDAVIFELGTGPRGENDVVTQLSWSANRDSFTLINQPSGTTLEIPTLRAEAARPDYGFTHYGFTYDAADGQLRHYVDGQLQPLPEKARLAALPYGEEAYFSLGRDGLWQKPLRGLLDEFRVSRGLVYTGNFEPPASFAIPLEPVELKAGLPLLIRDGQPGDQERPLQLGSRKHVFIDGALLDEVGDAEFVVNPPKLAERVIDNIEGDFRKHLTVVEGDDGVIRLYNSVEDDHLAVYTSVDGVNFEFPDVGRGEINGHRNIVIPDNVGGLGNPFFDAHAPAEERWKYFTDYQRRGIYLYTSPDGYSWNRHPTVILPFRSGTQSSTFYDDQRQLYVSYHRSGIFHTPAGDTQRSSVVTEHEDLRVPLPFDALTQQDYWDLRTDYPLREPLPWYADNGPLTPGGFGMEYPHAFDPIPEDPVGVDFYLTKATKYEWAPDTYVAFPVAYFHYENDGPEARRVLGSEEFGLGSGPLESQLSVSRNGIDWTRYPNPAYIGIGRHAGRDVKTAYIAHGMVRRGEEIWQYYFGETQYHSAFTKDPAGRGVYRVVQRLDGFVSLDSPYSHETTAVTKPIVFDGSGLELNVDTDAVGYLQVGFLDENGKPIEGFGVDDCIYVNGDFIAKDVQWLNGKDLSELSGKTVRMVLRMRGAKLYAMQFVEDDKNE